MFFGDGSVVKGLTSMTNFMVTSAFVIALHCTGIQVFSLAFYLIFFFKSKFPTKDVHKRPQVKDITDSPVARDGLKQVSGFAKKKKKHSAAVWRGCVALERVC